MSFSLIDVIFLIIILIFSVIASSKGFLKAIFSKLCWILGLFGAFLFYKKLSVHMTKLISNQTVSLIVCFVLIFVVIFLVVKIIQTLLEKAFEGDIMKGLDKALGFLFGLVEGLIIVFLIILILQKQPWFDVSNLFENSHIANFLLRFIDVSDKAVDAVKELA